MWLRLLIFCVVKFIYFEKATNFCEISTVDLSYVVTVKFTVEISENFVAFSEYMNFTCSDRRIKSYGIVSIEARSKPKLLGLFI